VTVVPGPSEARALDLVVGSYQVRGYDVTVEPRASGLPDFLRDLQPDLLAVRGDDRVAVIIRKGERNSGLRPVPDMDALHGGGWRLELVLADDLVLPSAPPEAIAARLAEASQFAETGHGAAALLLAWTAVEEVLRELTFRFAPDAASRRVSTPDSAYSLGLLSEDQHRFLAGVQRFRNQAAHTVLPAPIPLQLILQIAGLVNRMAKPFYVPPPIMADRALAELDQRQDPLEQVRRLFPKSSPEDQLEAEEYIRSLGTDDGYDIS
jgi:REase_AHJR-like